MSAAHGNMKHLLKLGESSFSSLGELVMRTADGIDCTRMELVEGMLMDMMGEYALALTVARGRLRLARAGDDEAAVHDAMVRCGELEGRAGNSVEAEALLCEVHDASTGRRAVRL